MPKVVLKVEAAHSELNGGVLMEFMTSCYDDGYCPPYFAAGDAVVVWAHTLMALSTNCVQS